MRLTIIAGLILGLSLAIQSMVGAHARAKPSHPVRTGGFHQVAPWYVAGHSHFTFGLHQQGWSTCLPVILSEASSATLICHPERSEQRERSGRITDSFASAEPVPVLARSSPADPIYQIVLIAPVEASSAGPTKSNASHPRSGSTRLTCTITGI